MPTEAQAPEATSLPIILRRGAAATGLREAVVRALAAVATEVPEAVQVVRAV